MDKCSPHPTSPHWSLSLSCTPTACSVSETLSLRDTGTSVLLEMLCWVACDCPPPPPDGVSPLQGEVPPPEAGLPAALPLTPCWKSSLILIDFCTDIKKISRLLSRVIPCQLPRGWAPDLDLDLANAGLQGRLGGDLLGSQSTLRTPLPSPNQSLIGWGLTDLELSTSSLPSQHDSPAAQKTHRPHPCPWSWLWRAGAQLFPESQKLSSTLTPLAHAF